ncbi:tail tubular protein A [uncultured Caudovirales phage]|uniref:Tail tubular protein A n=1 Tax=uncultured Caudovirales phage TaxID=2100421 RepID=A0A6J5KS61_9CAUD|nr:tail tubular protein A [uncultured Caudovirales phage]
MGSPFFFYWRFILSYFDTPLSQLDAVNICLSSMGEPSVNTLDGAAIDAQLASDLIDETSRSVQSMGFYWNREIHEISPNVNGEIVLPANVARVDSINGSKQVDVIQRGLRLYDKLNNTYSFDSSLTLEMVVLLAFEDLPLAAKQFITMRAARLLQQRLLGSEQLQKFNAADEQKSWVVLLQDEANVADSNMLYDNWSSGSILNRGYFARGAFN